MSETEGLSGKSKSNSLGSSPAMAEVQDHGTDSKLALDFSYLTNNSSFQRSIIEFIKKYIPGFENVNHRASKEVMTKQFNQNMINYKLVMEELKEVLKKRNERIF